ncbi:hypothetical protein AB0O28_04540 [Microbispora sp. NPDC088329]|uniref:hypothetical protein n=1 Tax=Microbispora sp. NPDC088329 TaxID=3154869 RepID=UPI00341FCBAF
MDRVDPELQIGVSNPSAALTAAVAVVVWAPLAYGSTATFVVVVTSLFGILRMSFHSRRVSGITVPWRGRTTPALVIVSGLAFQVGASMLSWHAAWYPPPLVYRSPQR